MNTYNKKEFELVEELLQVNFDSMQDCERKSQIESLVQIHNPKILKIFLSF